MSHSYIRLTLLNSDIRLSPGHRRMVVYLRNDILAWLRRHDITDYGQDDLQNLYAALPRRSADHCEADYLCHGVHALYWYLDPHIRIPSHLINDYRNQFEDEPRAGFSAVT